MLPLLSTPFGSTVKFKIQNLKKKNKTKKQVYKMTYSSLEFFLWILLF